jgi:hypothetical protein
VDEVLVRSSTIAMVWQQLSIIVYKGGSARLSGVDHLQQFAIPAFTLLHQHY